MLAEANACERCCTVERLVHPLSESSPRLARRPVSFPVDEAASAGAQSTYDGYTCGSSRLTVHFAPFSPFFSPSLHRDFQFQGETRPLPPLENVVHTERSERKYRKRFHRKSTWLSSNRHRSPPPPNLTSLTSTMSYRLEYASAYNLL